MKQVTIPVPNELIQSFLFSNGEISWSKEDETCFTARKPFIYDAAIFAEMESLRPWENPEDYLPFLFDEWVTTKEQIRVQFEKRDKNLIQLLMRLGISLFIEFLHWANEQPVRLSTSIEYHTLQIKPVNVQERLDFILARPNLYHSYMQLVELHKEMEKSYVKAKALKRS